MFWEDNIVQMWQNNKKEKFPIFVNTQIFWKSYPVLPYGT